MNKIEKKAETLLKYIIEISKETNRKDFEFTPYELLTLQSAYLLLKAILGE